MNINRSQFYKLRIINNMRSSVRRLDISHHPLGLFSLIVIIKQLIELRSTKLSLARHSSKEKQRIYNNSRNNSFFL